ncbi:MAG: permease-like cell division protein FtsX [Chitinophagaceae bacterium]
MKKILAHQVLFNLRSKGLSKKNTILLDEEDAAMLLALYTYAKPLTNEKLSHSKKGYLKINFANMLSDSLEARITLDPLYDTVSLAKDIEFFRQIDGVLDIKYISKEMAKSEYLADGNESWDKVLKDNPLPQSFELKLNPEKNHF